MLHQVAHITTTGLEMFFIYKIPLFSFFTGNMYQRTQFLHVTSKTITKYRAI